MVTVEMFHPEKLGYVMLIVDDDDDNNYCERQARSLEACDARVCVHVCRFTNQ